MTTRRVLKLAVAQYPVENLATFPDWQQKLDDWLARAHSCKATLAVFPEYAGLELVSLLPTHLNLKAQLGALQELRSQYHAACSELAQKYRLFLLAGTFPEYEGERIFNRARFYAPSGSSQYVDKLIITPFERAWGLSAGSTSPVFDTPLGRIGVAICYDCEFPAVCRRLAENGAELILVPSCTDTIAGANRVRIACQARALENQCFVAQSCTVGDAAWSAAIDENHGSAGVYAPPDNGLPQTGIIASGAMDEPCWVYAELDLDVLRAVRENGQVRNYADWIDREHLQEPIHQVRLE